MHLSLLLRLRPLLSAQRARLVSYAVLLLLSSMLAVAVPLAFQRVVDDGVAAGATAVAMTWIVVAVGLGLTAAGTGAVANAMGAEIGARMTEALRSALFDAITAQPYAFHAQSKAGAVVSRLTRSPVEAQRLIQSIFGTLVGQGVLLVLAVVALARLNPVAAVLVLAMVPLFMVPLKWFTHRLFVAGGEQSLATSEVEHFLTERLNVEGAVSRHLHDSYATESATFGALVTRIRGILVRRNRSFYGSQFVTSALAGIGVACAYGAGALQGASVGQIVAMAGLVKLIYDPIVMMSTQGLGLTNGLVAIEKVFAVLELPAARAGDRTLSAPATALSFEHVWFRHPTPGSATLPDLAAEHTLPGDGDGAGADGEDGGDGEDSWTLRDLTFSLVPGGTTALVGPSGAGKTTTALLAAGVHRPSGGRVLVDGVDLAELSAAARHRAVGMVTQDVFVLHASLRDNLAVGRTGATDAEIREALHRAQLGPLLGSLPRELDTVVGDRGFRLSGGERQRLSLARLFLADPDIVILDEATAHLDTLTEAALHDAMTRHLVGRTKLVIAHRQTTIENADRTVRLDRGRVVAVDAGSARSAVRGGR